MTELLHVSFYQIILFAFSCLLLTMNKRVRARRGALSSVLNLNDIKILWFVSAASAVVAVFLPGLFSVVAAGLALYGTLVWLDALLFVQYRIEVNRQTIAWCFTGAKGLQKGLPHLFEIIRATPGIMAIPVLWYLTLLVVHIELPEVVVGNWSGYLAAAVFAGLVLVILAARTGHWQSAFFTAPSLLGNIIATDNFVSNDSLTIDEKHRIFVKPNIADSVRSPLFGQCQRANVILITMESLGNYLQSPVNPDGIRSKIASRFRHHSWVSEQHYCLCPNTTVSTNQMYSGAYSNNPYNKEDSLYPGVAPKHLKTLKQQGYKTFFLDSADTGLYDYHKLLKRIGFDRVWGSKDLNGNGLKADYRLLNALDDLVHDIGDEPFFLHIINDQTHMPYEVVDSETYCRHTGTDARSVYMNAAEEADAVIDQFLNRLAEKIDLNNTILMFTGDHGESFGEFGYSFHSNSVILPQMHVPFMLHHPNLTARTISHSSHFDIFPTIFDLLGVEVSYPFIGHTLGTDERPYAYLFHSATLKGNTPANFGFLLDGELYWVDRLFNQVKHVQNNQCRPVTSKDQREYICSLLYQMLKQRAIMV